MDQIYEMESCIRKQEKALEERQIRKFTETSRDMVKEQVEAASRLKK